MKFFGVVSSLAVLIGATPIFDAHSDEFLFEGQMLFCKKRLLPERVYENDLGRLTVKEITVPSADSFCSPEREWLQQHSAQLKQEFVDVHIENIDGRAELAAKLALLHDRAKYWSQNNNAPVEIRWMFKRLQCSTLLRLALEVSDVQLNEYCVREAINMMRADKVFRKSVVSYEPIANLEILLTTPYL